MLRFIKNPRKKNELKSLTKAIPFSQNPESKKKKHNSPIQNSSIKQDLYIRTFKYMLVEILSFSVNYFVYSPISSVNL